MNETITLAEAIMVSMLVVIAWAATKTILEMIEDRSNKHQNS
jgi:hypothetical protein